jgi:hypothetical protein
VTFKKEVVATHSNMSFSTAHRWSHAIWEIDAATARLIEDGKDVEVFVSL